MDSNKPVFKCVPLDNGWTVPGTKLDLKAIYRRPRRSVGPFDEIIQEVGADGLPLWDLTTPLPLRRHSDQLAKGFEYVTLADLKSLQDAAPFLAARGLNWREFVQHPHYGPWNPKLYAASASDADRLAFDELAAVVYELGSDAVTSVRRTLDPNFSLPSQLQGIAAGTPRRARETSTAVPDAPVASTAPETVGRSPEAVKAARKRSRNRRRAAAEVVTAGAADK